MSTLLSDQLDQERIEDAHADLSEWLVNARTDLASFATSLHRAHREATIAEPVTALYILPMIKAARELEQQLSELIEVRK